MMIVIKTLTTVTSCNLLGRLAVLIIHLTRRVYISSFENLEDKLNTDRGNKMKKANIRIQKLYSNIRMECEYLNIRIFVDILNIKFKHLLLSVKQKADSAGADSGFLERGFKFTKGGSFC